MNLFTVGLSRLHNSSPAHTSLPCKNNIHLYADDTQLYTSFHPDESAQAMSRMEACIAEIRSWMARNFLRLNDSKTEFVIFGSDSNIARVGEQTVSIGDSRVPP